MNILFIAEFDPAGVCLDHRDHLRRAGHDARVALVNAWTPRQCQADYTTHQVTQTLFDGRVRCVPVKMAEGMPEFAAAADVVVVCPGIGQPWADGPDFFPAAAHADIDSTQAFGFDLNRTIPKSARRVAYFHGSVNTWAHREDYIRVYTARGYEFAASTLDYVVELGAHYLPPTIDPTGFERAPLRGPYDPLIVVHAPSNPNVCHTRIFMDMARTMGIVVRFLHRKPHAEVLAAKAKAHAGFDHLRGSFSVNTLENACMGLVPLVGLKEKYRDLMAKWGYPPLTPYIADAFDLGQEMAFYLDDPAATAQHQDLGRGWAEDFYIAAHKELLYFFGGKG